MVSVALGSQTSYIIGIPFGVYCTLGTAPSLDIPKQLTHHIGHFITTVLVNAM